ncbi:MAG: hypothetical protein EHM77_01190 [Planctomycetaceae bacterium]|nr:MAG: hypothetical protein EHM77_01190 [Planctomycetaceae bacterium]
MTKFHDALPWLAISLVAIAACIGCSDSPQPLGASSAFSGKLTTADGAPVGNVLLNLQPLESGHPVLLEVDEQGNFKGEGVPGEYAYFVAKSASKGASAEAALKKVPAEFLEANMTRKVKLGESSELAITLQ